MQQEATEKKMTPEEIKEMKTKTMEFYDKEIPYLEKTLKYEELITGIEEFRTRQVIALTKRAQVMTPPNPNKEEGKKTNEQA